MNPISLVTGKVWLYVGAAVVALLGVGLVVQTLRLAAAQSATDAVQAKFYRYRLDAEAAARLASDNYRREEQRRITAQKENDARALSELAAARADAAGLADALRRLRERAAADAARRAAAGHPQLVTSGAAAGPAPDLPTDVLGGLGEAAGQLAAYADAARIAGLACERSYGSLTEGAE